MKINQTVYIANRLSYTDKNIQFKIKKIFPEKEHVIVESKLGYKLHIHFSLILNQQQFEETMINNINEQIHKLINNSDLTPNNINQKLRSINLPNYFDK